MAQTLKRPAGAPLSTKSKKSNKKVANSLVTVSSAAVMAIYAAGYTRTRTAAAEIELQSAAAARRPVVPAPASADRPATQIADLTAAPVPVPTSDQAALTPETAAAAPAVPTEKATSPAAETPAASNPTAAAAAPAAPVAAAASTPAASTVAAAEPAAVAAPAAKEKEQVIPGPQAPAVAKAPAVKYKDGTYRGWGRSAHGEILAFVNIQGGRIVRAGIDKCQTRWSCTLVEHLGPQVVSRQSAEVDFVGGATQSGNAFYYGVVGALEQAAQAALEAPADTEGK